MKPEKFNGHGSFETFLCNLKIVAGIMAGIGEIKQPIFVGL